LSTPLSGVSGSVLKTLTLSLSDCSFTPTGTAAFSDGSPLLADRVRISVLPLSCLFGCAPAWVFALASSLNWPEQKLERTLSALSRLSWSEAGASSVLPWPAVWFSLLEAVTSSLSEVLVSLSAGVCGTITAFFSVTDPAADSATFSSVSVCFWYQAGVTALVFSWVVNSLFFVRLVGEARDVCTVRVILLCLGGRGECNRAEWISLAGVGVSRGLCQRFAILSRTLRPGRSWGEAEGDCTGVRLGERAGDCVGDW